MNTRIGPIAVGILLVACHVAEARADSPPPSTPPPTSTASLPAHERIVRFVLVAAQSAPTDPQARTAQALEIEFGDGHSAIVPPQVGSQSDEDDQPVRQVGFDSIQVAGDHRTIGWMATYMICAQSYPCAAELVLYQAGHIIQRIAPSSGIVWNWMFTESGAQIAVHSGFPHGDEDGVYSLYDVETGRLLESYTTGPHRPTWAEALDAAAP